MDADKAAYWAQRQGDWRASGLSQRVFCQRDGLSFAVFDYWRRLGKRPLRGLAAMQPLTLVPVRVVEEPLGELRLRSPAGWQLVLPSGMGVDALRTVLQALP